MNKMPQVYVTSESIGLVTEIDNNDIFIRIYDCLLKENIVIKIEDPGRIDKVSSFVTIYERGQKFNKKKFYTDGLHIYNNNDLESQDLLCKYTNIFEATKKTAGFKIQNFQILDFFKRKSKKIYGKRKIIFWIYC